MFRSELSNPRATLTTVCLTALQHTLQQATEFIRSQDPEAEVYIFQETSLGADCPHPLQVHQFTLVLSHYFSALLLIDEPINGAIDTSVDEQMGELHYPVELVFDSDAIARFLQDLLSIIPAENTLHLSLKKGALFCQPSSPASQGQFILKLLLQMNQSYDGGVPKTMHSVAHHNNAHHSDAGRNSDRSGERISSRNTPHSHARRKRKRKSVPPHQDMSTAFNHHIDQTSNGHNPDMSISSHLVETSGQLANSGHSLADSSEAERHAVAGQEDLLEQVVHQAQSADRVKTEFLAAMSHELRTPLTYILGMSSTLLRWSGANSQKDAIPERQRHYLQNIHNQGEHLLELINDLLDLSQLESGNLGLELQEFSLTLLIQQSLNVYRKKAKAKGVSLELDSHITAEGDRITADPQRLQQVVTNLLSNAIKFTPQSGQITVRLFADHHFVELQVRDTGIGIPEEHQGLIFQKFKQLDSSYHREYEGTGLGLALTKQLVDLHGGWIECRSTVDVGTVFTVKLPRQPFSPHPTASFPPKRTTSGQSLGRIVLVDDNDESGHFVSDMLTAAGYQLVWILEGLTAISQLEMLQPTVVIINEHLINNTVGAPNIIRILRQNPITKHLKLLILAHDDTPSSASSPQGAAHRSPNGSHATLSRDDEIYEGDTYGADIVMVHPLRPEELLHRVGILMAQQSSELPVR